MRMGAILLLTLLSACMHTNTVLGCLQVPNYTPAQESAVQKEMASHNPPTVEDQFIVDYGTVRAKNREACGE